MHNAGLILQYRLSCLGRFSSLEGTAVSGAYAPFSPSRTAMGTVRLGSPKQASGSSGIQSLAEAPRVAPLAGPSAAAAALRRQQVRVEARA